MIKFKMTFVFICLALIIIFLRINVNASSIQFNDAKVKLSDSTTVNLNSGENSVIKNEIYVCDNEIEINNYNVYLNVNNNDDTIYNEVLPIEDDISNVDVVTICGYLKWLGRSHDGTFMCPITINTTRLICLGGDSPSPYLQNFVWTSSSNSVIVSSFGTITAIEQFDSIVTITGVYKYNERFIVTINLVYV